MVEADRNLASALLDKMEETGVEVAPWALEVLEAVTERTADAGVCCGGGLGLAVNVNRGYPMLAKVVSPPGARIGSALSVRPYHTE